MINRCVESTSRLLGVLESGTFRGSSLDGPVAVLALKPPIGEPGSMGVSCILPLAVWRLPDYLDFGNDQPPLPVASRTKVAHNTENP